MGFRFYGSGFGARGSSCGFRGFTAKGDAPIGKSWNKLFDVTTPASSDGQNDTALPHSRVTPEAAAVPWDSGCRV